MKLRYELAIVVLVALAVLVPGITRYSLVDPWETHYGEVARNMRRNHDLVHMDWPGTNSQGDADEGFRSKPVLTFWMMTAAMTAVDLARDGGYSGEMVSDARTMLAIRLPFVACAVLGLALMWFMLARLVSRRVAWLSVLVVGSTPFFCLIARQGIPDMPLCMTVMGAMSMFVLAVEDGDRPASRGAVRALLGVCGGFAVAQAIYYAVYFTLAPSIAIPKFPLPAIFLPALIAVLLFGLWSRPWPRIRFLRMEPITTMRQVYLLWCYALLGVSVLAKGPPGVTVVVAVGVFHVLLLGGWRHNWELKRGLLLSVVIFLPWHIGMWLKEGPHFINEYLFIHILDRASADPDKSLGTFEYYTAQLGHGLWLWAALLPPAIAAALLRAQAATREARVRFAIALWAICGMAVFCLVTTKFHHYILPAVPALGILVAFFLDDLLAGRDRLHPVYAVLGIGIVLLVARDLMWEPERWIEMFIYRYDRPWPSAAPWAIDTSDGFLALGLVASAAIAALAIWRRAGVAAIGAAGLAICIWALQVYMPLAGTHWGMREAMRTYYQHRTIYGETIVYFGAREVYDDWNAHGPRVSFETFIPDALQVGQPMTVTLELRKPTDDRVTEGQLVLVGTATHIGDHSVEVTLPPAERAKLAPWIARGKTNAAHGRPPIHAVDADRLIAWQLYWRGEQFWSGGEIWAWLPEMKTTFPKTENTDLLEYLHDRTRAPLGRRYFVIGNAGQVQSLRGMLPTQHARDSFEVEDTTSNKFSLVSFEL